MAEAVCNPVFLDHSDEEAVVAFHDFTVRLVQKEKGISVRREVPGGSAEEKEIAEIEEKGAEAEYEVIGSPQRSISFLHLFFLGFKYMESFFEEIDAYSISTECRGRTFVVKFFRKKRGG